MATITITIPDELVPRVKAAMRATFPEHNGLTDVKTFKAVTAAYWRKILIDYEKTTAEQTYLAEQLVIEQTHFAERQAIITDAYEKAISDSNEII